MNQNNMWKLKTYVERIWRLGLDIAIESSKLGPNGKGMEVVANETRYFADLLYKLIDENSEEETPDLIENAAYQLQMLSVNSLIEMLRMHDELRVKNVALSLLLEGLNETAMDIAELLGNRISDDELIFETATRHPISNHDVYLMKLKVNDHYFFENVHYVQEIFNVAVSKDIIDGKVDVRGNLIPVVNMHKVLNHKMKDKCIAVIIDDNLDGNHYAVLVDEMNRYNIFKTMLGKDTACRDGAMNRFIRGCWDSKTDKQILFLDWSKL